MEDLTSWYKIRKRTSTGDPIEEIRELALITYGATGKPADFAVFSALEYDETQPREAYRLIYFSSVASKYCMTIISKFYGTESEAPSSDEEGIRVLVGDENDAKALLK